VTNYEGDEITINTNMQDPNAIVTVDRGDVESMERSDVSMMPEGLLNTLNEDELLDLMAFLLSLGNQNNRMFTYEEAATSASK
jgi:hypothetical protein